MTGRNSGKDFSQGQWQLLSIARAVVAQPSLLLLDEITANLDAETEKNGITGTSACSRASHRDLCIPQNISGTWKDQWGIQHWRFV